MKRNPLVRGLAATMAAATLLSVTAAPAAFAATPGSVSQPAAAVRTPLPPLNPAALRAAIAGLPNADETGALLQVRGPAGPGPARPGRLT